MSQPQPRSSTRKTVKGVVKRFMYPRGKEKGVTEPHIKSTNDQPLLSDQPTADASPGPQPGVDSQESIQVTLPLHTSTLPPLQADNTPASQDLAPQDEDRPDSNVPRPAETGVSASMTTVNSTSAPVVSGEALAHVAVLDGGNVDVTGSNDTTTITAANTLIAEDLPESSWTSKRTPLWNEAIANWKKSAKGQAQCEEIEKLMTDASSNSIEAPGFLSPLQPETKSSSKWRLRLKRCEPILNATRGIAVTLANADPHKVAPLIVHSVFAGINILFNRMSPENTDKILDILFGCSDTIRECVSFELYFAQKSNPVVEEDMIAIRKALPVLYLRALCLMYEVQSSCKNVERQYSKTREKWLDWVQTRGLALWREVSDKIVQWESEERAIKRQTGKWARLKKTLDDKLKADKDVMEVRGWVRAEEDPEPTLHTIKKTVMPEGRYDNAGQWFLGSAQFLDWCGTFHASQSEDIQPKTSDQLPATDTASVDAQGPTPDPSHDIVTTGSHEPPALFTPNEECPVSGSSELNTADDVKEEDPVAKRVLWLRGGYKKGKTTIMYHTYVSMDTSADFRLVDKELRVIPYFCDASSTDQTNQKRPKHETILRGLLWHMSLLPDFGLAEPVQDKYNAYHSTRAPKQKPEVEDWETLFTNLVSDDRYHYTFMVDALDECLSPEQSAKFLEFMSKVLKAHPNTSLLCSSHAQVNIQVFFGQDNDYFGADTLEVVDVTAEKSMDDMNYFIQSELERRRVQAKRSIFYNPQHQDLLANLEDALKSDAQGNFRWVQIWLDILLPKDDYNDMLTIKDEEVAKQRLRQLQVNMTYKHDEYQQLEAGYQRLWDLNRLIDAEELKLRDRLFHIVLASEWAQTPETLSKVLRFRERSYSNYPQPIDVERMSSNFLVYVESSSGNEGFRFVDEAAKRFVLSMDSPESNNATKPKTKVFARQNNHKAVAEVYTQLIGSATHPYWQHAGLLPFNWTKLLSGNEDSERLKLDIQHWRTKRYGPLPDFHFYLAKFGFRHCAEAAEEHSLYDPVWTEVIKKVILNPRSAFGFVALAEEQVEPAQMFRVYTAPLATWMMWGQQDGRLQLLHSHAIALLDIASPDDSIRLQTALQDLKGKPDEILNSYEYRLFKDSACVGGAIAAPPGYVSTIKHKEATALQIACVQHNRATVEMILEVSSTLTHIPADHILYIDTATFPFPLCISIAPRDEFDTGAVLNNTARPLLLYEKRLDILRRDSVDSNKAHETPAIAPFKSKQWSLLHHTDKDPALILGALFHRGDMLLHMLRIAPPEDINVRGIDDYTALHFAAGQGNDVVVRGLVEEFGADVNLENSEGHTPGMLARRNGFTRVVQYLKERGADVGDSEDEDAPNRDTLIDAIFAQVGEF